MASSKMGNTQKLTESAQKVHSYDEYLGPLRDEALRHVSQYRSSPYEVPVNYKDLLMNHQQKERWLNNF